MKLKTIALAWIASLLMYSISSIASSVPDTLAPQRINQLIALNYYSLMYQKQKATVAESEVMLLRVMSSTLNAQNETLADEVRKARLEHARVELQNTELREKLERRNKALAVVSAVGLAIIVLLALN
jgi:uncharacterized protein YlxW (UPF0749 family)